ncbi:MAG: hypothetical protein II010_03250, partial [Oscillospiraceae bacterium]|nr:hypothetical protein [Oscillospiraceae bacterium]
MRVVRLFGIFFGCPERGEKKADHSERRKAAAPHAALLSSASAKSKAKYGQLFGAVRFFARAVN